MLVPGAGPYPASVSDLLEVSVEGRLTPESLAPLADRIDGALRAGGTFAVLFDRRPMTAPTPAGRAALERWAAGTMPLLRDRCAAWADVLDERRAASIARARGGDEDAEDAARGYPQRTFADEAAARAWVTGLLASAPAR